MSIFKTLSSLFQRSDQSDAHLLWIHVQCDHCQEHLRIHVDLRNDLSIQYGESDRKDTYFTRKIIVGKKRCFKPIEVELTFDRHRRLLDQQIQGGSFISAEEYQARDLDSAE